jgi:hypothetical protein
MGLTDAHFVCYRDFLTAKSEDFAQNRYYHERRLQCLATPYSSNA